MAPLEIAGSRYVPTGSSLIFADMLQAAVSQGRLIFIISLLGMIIMVWVEFRNVRHTARIILSLLLGLSLLAAVIKFTTVNINFYNMVIFAAIVGMGIDTSIHIYSRWLTFQPKTTTAMAQQPRAISSIIGIGSPVSVSMTTTIAGYSGLISSHHPGLRSIGTLAVVGLSTCFIAGMVFLPLYLKRLELISQQRQLPLG